MNSVLHCLKVLKNSGSLRAVYLRTMNSPLMVSISTLVTFLSSRLWRCWITLDWACIFTLAIRCGRTDLSSADASFFASQSETNTKINFSSCFIKQFCDTFVNATTPSLDRFSIVSTTQSPETSIQATACSWVKKVARNTHRLLSISFIYSIHCQKTLYFRHSAVCIRKPVQSQLLLCNKCQRRFNQCDYCRCFYGEGMNSKKKNLPARGRSANRGFQRQSIPPLKHIWSSSLKWPLTLKASAYYELGTSKSHFKNRILQSGKLSNRRG